MIIQGDLILVLMEDALRELHQDVEKVVLYLS